MDTISAGMWPYSCVPVQGLICEHSDWLLGNITKTPIIGTNITEDMVFSGNTSWASYTYQTTFKYVQGILPNTSDAVNHNYSVPAPGINASDGWLAIMNVQIVAQPDKPS